MVVRVAILRWGFKSILEVSFQPGIVLLWSHIWPNIKRIYCNLPFKYNFRKVLVLLTNICNTFCTFTSHLYIVSVAYNIMAIYNGFPDIFHYIVSNMYLNSFTSRFLFGKSFARKFRLIFYNSYFCIFFRWNSNSTVLQQEIHIYDRRNWILRKKYNRLT